MSESEEGAKEEVCMGGEFAYFNTYEEMYESQYDKVHNYIKRTIRNHGEAVDDLTQDVFFVAYQKWGTLRNHPNIPGFLTVVAKNKIKKWFEKQSRILVDDTEAFDTIAQEDGLCDNMDAYQIVDFYSTVEHTLSDKDLQILRHYYEYGYTSSEMAERLGITESCFKIRVARMKKKLKNSMKVLMLLAVSAGSRILFLL